MSWWYIASLDKNGKAGLAGPYPTPYQAQRTIDKKYEIEATVVEFESRNLATATRIFKEEKIQELGFETGHKRIGHPKEEKSNV